MEGFIGSRHQRLQNILSTLTNFTKLLFANSKFSKVWRSLWCLSTLPNFDKLCKTFVLWSFSNFHKLAGKKRGFLPVRSKMESDRKKLCLAASAAIIAVVVRRRRRRREQSQRKKRLWTRPWILKREQFGAYHCLLEELKLSDRNGLKNFLRMDESSFNEILDKVAPLIQKQDTQLRASISPAERLALTLRYLASGKEEIIIF